MTRRHRHRHKRPPTTASASFPRLVNPCRPQPDLLLLTSTAVITQRARPEDPEDLRDAPNLPCAWAGARVARAVGGTWSVLLVGGSNSMTVGGAHGSLLPRPPFFPSPAAAPPTGNLPSPSFTFTPPSFSLTFSFSTSLFSLLSPRSVGSTASFLLLLPSRRGTVSLLLPPLCRASL